MFSFIHTVVVTIGKDGCHDWYQFQADTHQALLDHQAVVLQRPDFSNPHGQIGEWEGKPEFASAFVAFVDIRYLHALRDDLDDVRIKHNQSAIGFIVVPGTHHLIAEDQ